MIQRCSLSADALDPHSCTAICHVTLTTTTPLPGAYAPELMTLGDQLHGQRLDLGLGQRNVAERVDVQATIMVNQGV